MFKNIFKTTGLRVSHEEKVFCIGLNKTGTTSIEFALKGLGYNLGDQHKGELLLEYYARREFSPIIEFCNTADAFQDAPFSYPFTFFYLDHYFPKSKFILTVRDSDQQWLDSLIKFQAKLFGGGKVPTKEILSNAFYLYRGRPWESNRVLFNTPENDIYHRPTLLAYYNAHLYNAREYFRLKSNFLELNVSENGSYTKFCDFLGHKPILEDFPWENRT